MGVVGCDGTVPEEVLLEDCLVFCLAGSAQLAIEGLGAVGIFDLLAGKQCLYASDFLDLR